MTTFALLEKSSKFEPRSTKTTNRHPATLAGRKPSSSLTKPKPTPTTFSPPRKALFQKRIEQDWIRACHGDLHLNNIAYWQDQLYLFDCIEFNEPFRYVDVMYDVGFVVMDLLAKDCPQLANVFLNHYVEQTGDWEGLQLLPLYVSRQAYVRAKVTSFLLNDPSVDVATKEAASQIAARYYRLAWSVVQSPTWQAVCHGWPLGFW